MTRQLLDYLTTFRLLLEKQSAYQAYHSTETAVLKVPSDILLAVDTGDLAALTLLDLGRRSTHSISRRRLHVSYGLDGPVHRWFTSYLKSRTQYVRCGSARSAARLVLYGIPQGSVLGPVVFLLYTDDLIQLVESHDPSPHPVSYTHLTLPTKRIV